MKKLIFISLLFSILSLSVSAQKPTKAEKDRPGCADQRPGMGEQEDGQGNRSP